MSRFDVVTGKVSLYKALSSLSGGTAACTCCHYPACSGYSRHRMTILRFMLLIDHLQTTSSHQLQDSLLVDSSFRIALIHYMQFSSSSSYRFTMSRLLLQNCFDSPHAVQFFFIFSIHHPQ
ncbi:hypothetical protein JTE90_005124 [Oedothorax gibbosus]|uniref:Uncharacterized protein n=1 Tax=Oedothorax gibbosus TaxID=931172 RepID=A0AAV6UKX7_9ARAC|nr:hypothetical protein JTE90_005124 [Oedothorax gibbosus]